MTPLYFETARQSATFLTLCAAGFLAAFVVEMLCALPAPHLHPVRDIFAMLGMGVMFLGTLALTRDDQLRLYQPLAYLSGCILYSCGFGRALHALLRGARMLLKKYLPKRPACRKPASDVENKKDRI